jgi:hypothetical protein
MRLAVDRPDCTKRGFCRALTLEYSDRAPGRNAPDGWGSMLIRWERTERASAAIELDERPVIAALVAAETSPSC